MQLTMGFYSLKETKENLQKFYNIFDINKKAKATDIENYLNIKKISKTIEDKKENDIL